MKALRVSVAVAFVLLLAFSYVPKGAVAQTSSTIDKAEATTYITNLISDYNALVGYSQKGQPYFYMYDNGGTFNVTVVWNSPNNYSLLAFFFEPIAGSKPIVTPDYRDTYGNLAGFSPTTPGHTITFGPGYGYDCSPYGTVVFDVFGSSSAEPARSYLWPVVWLTSPAMISNSTEQTDSYYAANCIYQSNLDVIDTYLTPHTNPILAFLSNPWVEAILVIAGLIMGVYGSYGTYRYLKDRGTEGRYVRHPRKSQKPHQQKEEGKDEGAEGDGEKGG